MIVAKADQRFMEYRRRFSDVAEKVVERRFDMLRAQNALYDDVWRLGYVERAGCGETEPDFLWKTFPLVEDDVVRKYPIFFNCLIIFIHQDWKRKGLFLNPLILETFALHLHEIQMSQYDAAEVEDFPYPIGALAVSTCSVSYRLFECFVALI